jgi:hypothetical protein
LVLDELFRLQEKVDDFEELSLGPDAEEGQRLKDIHLLKFALSYFIFQDSLEILFRHHCEVHSRYALNGSHAHHWLIYF